MEPVFSCCDLCCNARKWWQGRRWSGMVSLAPKWGLRAGEHCCSCTLMLCLHFKYILPVLSMWKFIFRGNTRAYRIHSEKYVCLVMGCLDFVPRFAKQKHQWDRGKCQIVHDPSVPCCTVQLAVIHNSGCECLCLSKVEHSSQFSQTEAMSKEVRTSLLPWYGTFLSESGFVLFPPRNQLIL